MNARPSEAFRLEHGELRAHLSRLADRVGLLSADTEAVQRETLADFLRFLEAHIGPHAAWEETHLYPIADRLVGGRESFTAALHHEHRIIRRRARALAEEAALPNPDWHTFVRHMDRLMGLLEGHFETEEEVLLPILDREMSAEQFATIIGARER